MEVKKMAIRRMTLSLTPKQYDLLDVMAEAMEKSPQLVAKEILQQTLDGMQFLVEKEGGQEITNDIILKRLFKVSLNQMLRAIDEFDNSLTK